MKNIVSVLIVALLCSAALAQAHRAKVVKFPAGSFDTTLKDGIARGETLTYLLGAGAGQEMTVSVTSQEDNAVFKVVAPNGRVIGNSSMTGEMDQVWVGRLPVSGDYKVVVGSTRGGSSFSAYFMIR